MSARSTRREEQKRCKQRPAQLFKMSGGMCPFAARQQPDARTKDVLTSEQPLADSPEEGSPLPCNYSASTSTSTCPEKWTSPVGHDSTTSATTKASATAGSFKKRGDSGAAVCPLGFGSSGSYKAPTLASFVNGDLPRMPLAILAGHADAVRLISLKGIVFDVSEDHAFGREGALERLPGHDVSRIIAVARREVATEDQGRGGDDDLDAGLEELKYEEHQRLESFFVEMANTRRAVAVLADEDYRRIFGTPLQSSGHGASAASSIDDAAATLHASVEQGDVDSVTQLLRKYMQHDQQVTDGKREKGEASPEYGSTADGNSKTSGMREEREDKRLVDSPCPRTGMTPLLKAVEGASEELVGNLLDAGADVRPQASLYDGDDAIALARRLGSRDAIVELLLPYYN